MNEVMDFFKTKRLHLPSKIISSSEDFKSLVGSEDYLACFRTDGSIRLNPHFAWDTLTQMMSDGKKIGYFASDDIDHFAFHELAHLNHHKSNPKLYNQLPDWHPDIAVKQLKGKISEYALESPKEFVAEVLTMHLKKIPISKEIRRWYDFYGGPPF